MAVELSFTDMGAGPPLVILHGLFGSKRNWTNIAHRFATGHRVLAADLRNHGDSPWDKRHDYPAMAEDVAALIRTHVGSPPAVVGHSMGGKVAMMLALDHPELVERLVVVDIAPVVSTGTPIEYVRALRSLSLATFSNRADVKDALAGAIPDPAIRAFMMLNLATGPAGLSWTVNLDAIEAHFSTILGFPEVPPGRQFTKPVLFLVGGRSHYVQPHHRPEIERLFPAATFEVIEAAGHWVHADAADAFVEKVSRFLSA
ncbi:MAG: alpha/beta fold hydrolase [Planctomycetota bacterium]|nr:MAG: alpha/beta fold hydrolase [Planctomycetota bacterium]